MLNFPSTERWTLELNNPLAAFPGHTIKRATSPFTPVCIVPAGSGLTGEIGQEARATLIAAAPDLLAAMPTAVGHPGGRLVKVVAHYESGTTQTVDGEVVLAAVEKATGGAA